MDSPSLPVTVRMKSSVSGIPAVTRVSVGIRSSIEIVSFPEELSGDTRSEHAAHIRTDKKMVFFIVFRFVPQLRGAWSRIRESDPPPWLGKPMHYRCANPALSYDTKVKVFVLISTAKI